MMLSWPNMVPEILLLGTNKRFRDAYGARWHWRMGSEFCPEESKAFTIAAIKMQTWY